MSARVDVDDVTRCPQASACERCGKTGSTVEAIPVDLAHLGMACATLCWHCQELHRLPKWGGVVESAERVARHCEHLNITPDGMAEALAAEWAEYQAECAAWAGGAR